MKRLFLVSFTAAVVACGGNGTPSDSADNSAAADSPSFPVLPLRLAAERAGFNWGAAVEPSLLDDDPEYAKALAGNFTILTAENALKFDFVHPQPGIYDFSAADRLAEFARDHRMKMRGHVLIWHEQLPDWVKNGSYSRDQLIAVMRDHIFTVLGHYRENYGDVFIQWDVVNESFLGDGSRRQSIWQQVIGDDYIELAFKFAHEAWPEMELYYNDFEENNFVLLDVIFHPSGALDPQVQGAGPGATAGFSDCDLIPKCAAIKAMATGFKARGVPMHGVGFQAHIANTVSPDYAQLSNWIEPL